MKVKELIKILNLYDPEAEINFQIGRNDNYRKACASLVLEDKEYDGCGCLEFMCIDVFEEKHFANTGDSELLITLVQNYYTDKFFEDYLATGIVNGKFTNKVKKA